MNKRLRIALSMILLLCCTSVIRLQAQDRTITGKVTSLDGETLPAVTVLDSGTINAVVTDISGNYSIKISPNSKKLIFTSMGFSKEEASIGASNTINITMLPDIKSLSEIVVVGYGVEQKALTTGSLDVIKAEEVKDIPVGTIDQKIQGQSAGVQVIQNSGTPGSEISMRIRGTGSISGSSQPLYVIDGIPVTTGDFAQVGYEGQGINALSDLNPNDIESISVLKDASAAAIYGARASNGVVLITTKRGAVKKPVITFNSYYGMQQAWRKLEMMDAKDWMLYRNDLEEKEVFTQNQINNITTNTDWQDEIFRTAPMSSYELSATGGNADTRYFISGGMFNQEGILIGTDYSRLNARMNLDQKINDKLNTGVSIGITYAKTDRVEGDQSLHGPLPNGISTPAIFPVYNEDGTYNQEGPYSNAVSIAEEAINQNFSFRTIGNIYADYRILPRLVFTTKWGTDFLNLREHAYESVNTVQGDKYNGLGFETYSNVLNIVSNNLLKYNITNGKNEMEFLAGYSFEKFQVRRSLIRAQDFADENLEYINSATTIAEAYSSGNDDGLRSWFGRANFNNNNKYLLTVSARVDGSSRFGENNRNGFFPAASVGWRISEEKFFHKNKINELKLRTSYGLTGNDDIPPFLYADLYSNTSYNGQPGLYPSNIPNPDLKWETTAQLNIGTDIGLFENRITFTADYYIKKTKDLLLSRPLPPSSGFSSVTENVGEVENKGIELSLSTTNLMNKSVTWNTSINFSINRNKVTKLYNDQPIDDLGRGSSRIEVGEAIGIFYSYESLGVDPSTGDIVYKDVNGDGQITAADRTKVGNPHPDFIAGITNTLSWKGFDMSVFLQMSYGNDVFNGSRLFLESLQGGDNQLAVVNDRWQTPGDITAIPDATSDPVRAANNNRVSSRFIEDGSYLRIKNLTVGYTFKKYITQKLKINNLRLYISSQNLFTFTNYSGLDPEVNYIGNNNSIIGTDFFTYPQARSFIAGLNLTF